MRQRKERGFGRFGRSQSQACPSQRGVFGVNEIMAEMLPFQVPDGQLYFSPLPLRRPWPSQVSLPVAWSGSYSPSRQQDYPSTEHNEDETPSPLSSQGPIQPSEEFEDGHSGGLSFRPNSGRRSAQDLQITGRSERLPSYCDISAYEYQGYLKPDTSCTTPLSDNDSSISINNSSTPEPLPVSKDDTAVKQEPWRHVDYLSHDWGEDDIWSSWRHIVTNRNVYSHESRLENASWRIWAKTKYRLQTVSPGTIDWFKDCDVTWLYGPLQTRPNSPFSDHISGMPSQIAKNNSSMDIKPALKKQTMSEVILQRLISNLLLAKQVAATVEAHQNGAFRLPAQDRPKYGHATSEVATWATRSTNTSGEATDYTSQSTSGLPTPRNSGKKQVRFDDNIKQYFAVDDKYCDDYEEDGSINSNDSDSSDGGLEIRTKLRRSSYTNSKSSFSPENKITARAS